MLSSLPGATSSISIGITVSRLAPLLGFGQSSSLKKTVIQFNHLDYKPTMSQNKTKLLHSENDPHRNKQQVSKQNSLTNDMTRFN